MSDNTDIRKLAEDVLAKAEGLSVPLPLMMSPNVLRPGIISTKLPEHFMVARETEWDDGEYLIASANAAPALAAAVIRQAEEMEILHNAVHMKEELSDGLQVEIARLRTLLGQAAIGVRILIGYCVTDDGGRRIPTWKLIADTRAIAAAIDAELGEEPKRDNNWNWNTDSDKTTASGP